MGVLFDVLYAIVLLITSPIWLIRLAMTGKLRTDWPGRFGRAACPPRGTRPRIVIHAVSVGEVNAIRMLVRSLAASSVEPEIIIATTTNTGTARARALFADDHGLIRYPLDFTLCVSRWLDHVRPDVLLLTELEVWPNMMRACAARDIQVCVVNGRLTERSHRRYRFVRSLIRPMFARLDRVAVQNEPYAERFIDLGARAERVMVMGSMKWDTAQIADSVEGAEQLAGDMGIDLNRPLIVAGSTAPDEHELIRDAVPAGVQLLCAPRKPEHFDDAARVLGGCARRSRGDRGSDAGRFLLDTIGELRMAYSLADVVVIGRSFGDLHGSDMIEPVALGKATIVGPAVTDFADIAAALRDGGGLLQVDRTQLAPTIAALLADDDRRSGLGAAGREVIRAHQGATDRHVRLILDELDPSGLTERSKEGPS